MELRVGDVLKVVYGLDEGARYKVVSEPYSIDMKGNKGIDVVCLETSNMPGGCTVGDEMIYPLSDLDYVRKESIGGRYVT